MICRISGVRDRTFVLPQLLDQATYRVRLHDINAVIDVGQAAKAAVPAIERAIA